MKFKSLSEKTQFEEIKDLVKKLEAYSSPSNKYFHNINRIYHPLAHNIQSIQDDLEQVDGKHTRRVKMIFNKLPGRYKSRFPPFNKKLKISKGASPMFKINHIAEVNKNKFFKVLVRYLGINQLKKDEQLKEIMLVIAKFKDIISNNMYIADRIKQIDLLINNLRPS